MRVVHARDQVCVPSAGVAGEPLLPSRRRRRFPILEIESACLAGPSEYLCMKDRRGVEDVEPDRSSQSAVRTACFEYLAFLDHDESSKVHS